LRCFTDYCLSNSDVIREVITSEMNLGKQKVANRNSKLEVRSLGKDQNKHNYFRLDDTPRIYRSGNTYRKDCPFEIIARTEEEIQTFANLLSTTDSPTKASSSKKAALNKPGKWTSDEGNERKLKDKLRSLAPQLEKGEERLAELAKQRASLVKAKEKKEREAAEAVAIAAEPRELGTRGRSKRVNYADIEDGVQSTGIVSEYASGSESLRDLNLQQHRLFAKVYSARTRHGLHRR
jgi:hypothetical protein